MSDYIEVELIVGLNWVVYKNTNDGIQPDTQLFLKNDGDNEYTPIGTLDEVREKTPAGSSTEVMNKEGNQVATMDSKTGALLDNITLYAKNPNTPTNKGGKRKTKKYFRKRKTDKRKSKRKKKGKGKGKTRKFR